MIKFGITSRGRRERMALRLERENRGWWPFAYTLLEHLDKGYRPTDDALLERLYASMAGGEMARKITRRGRFRELDDRILDELDRRFGSDIELSIHDAAASNGITSLELFRGIARTRSVEFLVTDLFDSIWIVELPGSRWKVVFDTNGLPLQVVGMGLVISCRRQSPWRYPVNRLVGRWAVRTIVPVAQGILNRVRASGEIGTEGRHVVRRVRLFHPECVQAEREEAGFFLSRHDLTETIDRKFHLVRVMNALTPRHLEDELVRRGIRAATESLVPGGVLVLGRSPEECDDETRVTAYERTEGSLRPIWSLHGGYEWPSLVDAPG